MSGDKTLPSDFDPEWYRKTYPDVEIGALSPQEHFRRFGATMGRFPSAERMMQALQSESVPEPAPTFSQPVGGTIEIPEVAAILDGPIIPAPSDIAKLSSKFSVPPRETILLTPSATAVSCKGQEIARLSSQHMANADEYAVLTAPLRALSSMLEAHNNVAFHLRAANSKSAQPLDLTGDVQSCAHPALQDGPFAVCDAWYVTDSTLRLMFGTGETDEDRPATTLRAWQCSAEKPLRMKAVGAADLTGQGPVLCDLDLFDPLMPVLLELCDQNDLTVGMALLAFPSLLRGGLHGPELMASLPMGRGMTAFWQFSDQLLREGFGQDTPRSIGALEVDLETATGAEAIFGADMQHWLAAVFGLRLSARNTPADPDALETPGRAYLSDMLASGAALPAYVRTDKPKTDPKAGGHGATLVLPADSIPTLGALVSHRLPAALAATGLAGPFIVADIIGRRGRWSVSLPMVADFLANLQPRKGVLACPILQNRDTKGSGAARPGDTGVPAHLSIALRSFAPEHEAEQLMPISPDGDICLLQAATPDTAPLTLVLTVSDHDQTRRFLQAFKGQIGCDQVDVLAYAEKNHGREWHDALRDVLTGAFPEGRVALEYGDRGHVLDLAASWAQTDLVLLADDTIMLPDQRTLSTLSTLLAADPSVASASCALMREKPARKGTIVEMATAGVFPTHVSLMTAPQLVFGEPDCLAALPMAVFPVMANTLDLVLVRRSALQDGTARRKADGIAYGRDGAADVRFGLDLLAGGGHNLCTTAVRCGTLAPPRPVRDEMDSIGLSFMRPRRWDDILPSVTLLRELV